MNRIFLLIALLLLLLLAGCGRLSSRAPLRPGTGAAPYKAVYLSDGPGELAAAELQAHAEVIAVATFDELKSHAGSRIALWIDRNAVTLVDRDWLNQPPQKYDPLVLVGYNDPLYCFRDILHVGTIEGPYVDWSEEDLEPGFCVWMIQSEGDGGRTATFQGHAGAPSLQDILDVTNPLLDVKQDIRPARSRFWHAI